jgi:hypothetical protein
MCGPWLVIGPLTARPPRLSGLERRHVGYETLVAYQDDELKRLRDLAIAKWPSQAGRGSPAHARA